MIKILFTLIAMLLILPLTNAICIYGTGVYGTGVYGGDCGGITPPVIGGGAPSSATILDKNTEPINNTCHQKQQLYDGKCYDCDPFTSYIQWTPENRELLCQTCNEGYVLSDNSCVEGQKFNVGISYSNISLIIIILLGIALYLNKKRKKGGEVKKESEEEDND